MLAHAASPQPGPGPERPSDRSPASPPSTISIQRVKQVLVLRPTGRLDRHGVQRLREHVRAADEPIVIHLDDCVVVAPSAFDHLASPDHDDRSRVEVCIVCRRLTCRRLLARVGVLDRFPVFQQLEDALQALVLARAGYGDGWLPPPPHPP